MVNDARHIGVGLYGLAEAARLTGAHPATVRHWLSDGGGIVPRQLPKEEKLLTFPELMELHFIRLFRREGVSFQVIRKASIAAAIRFQTDFPFTLRRFDTDGRTIFETLLRDESGELLTEDLRHGQYVFRSIVRPFFRKLDYRESDGQVIRFWPCATGPRKGRVVLDPARKFGQPIDAATGVSTRAIVDALNAGGGQKLAVVARWLNIPPAAINAAVDFEQSIG